MREIFRFARVSFFHLRIHGLRSLLILIFTRIGMRQIKNETRVSKGSRFSQIYPIWEKNSTTKSSKYTGEYSVIIPIYNGFINLQKLRQSMQERKFNLILIDDCSTDSRIEDFLIDWSKEKNVKIIRNSENLGYTKSVNLAIEKLDHDFILLNSDTTVHADWADRLMNRLYLHPQTAAVTPFSNSASIFSWPTSEPGPLVGNVEEIDEVAAKLEVVNKLPAPTINGFCVAIKYSAWIVVGDFNHDLFSVGYGEENDWSIRARENGFQVELAPNVFVHHIDGGSFDPKVKKNRLEKSWHDLKQLHPNYEEEILVHFRQDPWEHLRRSIELGMAISAPRKTSIYLSHGIGGGAEVWMHQEIYNNLSAGETCIIVVPGVKDFLNLTFSYKTGKSVQEFAITHVALNDFESIIKFSKISKVVINSLVHWKQTFEVLDLLKNYCHLTFIGHDYYAICPSYNLLNQNFEFCAVPDEPMICNECYAKNSLIPRNLPTNNLVQWRQNFQKYFSLPESELVFFSKDSKQWFEKAYEISKNNSKIVLPNYTTQSRNLNFRKTQSRHLNIAFVGHINRAKGSQVLQDIIIKAKEQSLPCKFHLIGEIRNISSLKGNIKHHGKYDRKNLNQILKNWEIDLVIIPSIWPETYNIVTDEVVAAGVRVVVSPLGAMKERLKHHSLVSISDGLTAEDYLKVVKEILETK